MYTPTTLTNERNCQQKDPLIVGAYNYRSQAVSAGGLISRSAEQRGGLFGEPYESITIEE